VKARRRRPARLVVGLTGGFGSGKSTALAAFRRLGARTADADAEARRLLKRGSPGHRRVLKSFGRAVLSSDGTIDRRRLAEAVFSDARLRRRLERILHPAVRRTLRALAKRHRRGVLVLDVPLLFEAGWRGDVDRTVTVWAPLRTRLRRLARRGFARPEALRRIKAQWPLERKCRLSDHVLDNGGPRSAVRRQVRLLFHRWTRRPTL
jgi:dephospho-CoA kinase